MHVLRCYRGANAQVCVKCAARGSLWVHERQLGHMGPQYLAKEAPVSA